MKTRLLTAIHIEPASAWDRLTQNDRQRMSVPELIQAMGPLWCQHPDFKSRPRTVLPNPNLTGMNGPVIEKYDATWAGQIKMVLAWALR